MKSISIPVNRHTQQPIFCKCTPEIRNQEIRLGIPIQFNVQIDGIDQFESFKYSIYFDCEEWMLSGSSTGFAKVGYNIISVNIFVIIIYSGKLEICHGSYIIWPIAVANCFILRSSSIPCFY